MSDIMSHPREKNPHNYRAPAPYMATGEGRLFPHKTLRASSKPLKSHDFFDTLRNAKREPKLPFFFASRIA